MWMAARQSGGWCALKVMHPFVMDDASVQGRFHREAAVASRLRHRNIAGVVRSGSIGRRPYIDMELVAGVSLGALVGRLRERGEAVPPGLLWSVNDGVLCGLDYAHNRTDDAGQSLGLVHRDLTPANVLIGYDGIARIIDFGMVRACVGPFQTMLGQIGGTPMYMSPEQARGRRVDRRSDLYGWAVVMAEMLTGHRLVQSGALPVMLKSVLYDPAPAMSGLSTELPSKLDPVFALMLEKDPARRPATAASVRRAFGAVVGSKKWSEGQVADFVQQVFADRYAVFEQLQTQTLAINEAATWSGESASLAGMAEQAHPVATVPPTVIRTIPMTEPAFEATSL